jgi:peptide/nickel transport system ATP-binding protein
MLTSGDFANSASAPSDRATDATARAALLSVENLRVHFVTTSLTVAAVTGVSFHINKGEIVAIVGESGSGKSVTALSIMRLLTRQTGRIPKGHIYFRNRDLLTLSEDEMRAIRGREISMIFQEPMTSLNPVLTIGQQIGEPLQIHLGMTARQARARARELLRMVGIANADQRLDQYPHQFSGGMRQRVMIAIGLACSPKLIIADEPTTALDVTIQAQILELMKDLSQKLDIALLIITHNLGVVARYADRVAVMYAGRIIEEGAARPIFHSPRHPYTLGLLRSVPRLDRPRSAMLETIEGLPPDPARPPPGCRFAPRCSFRLAECERMEPPLCSTREGGVVACIRADDIFADLQPRSSVAAEAAAPRTTPVAPLLSVRGLTKHFPVKAGITGARGIVRAVENVSFDVIPGETLGLVGESGCGKTTVGRMILRLEKATAGEITFAGEDVMRAGGRQLKALRHNIQAIFQDPYSSLNPRMTVAQIIEEPIAVHRLLPTPAARRERVAKLLDHVGLRPEMAERYPHQLSGGQRQRVGIARALAIQPKFIVCDEAVSALDVSIQGQIINLLAHLQREFGLAFLFIAHDLAVVRHVSARIIVMYLGRVMEVGSRDELYGEPLHPYTRLLLDAAPVPDPDIERKRAPRLIEGELPSPLALPQGCVFNTRCPKAGPECRQTVPPLREIKPGHMAACIKV